MTDHDGASPSSPQPGANRLGDESSPYLLQHRNNPVHWLPWGDEAFELARTSNRPVLLSVGYAACHWCHVMAHESFEDPDIAAQMNRDFVNIKVDREERPDIDHLYQAALAAMGEHGGWPLTMFLTPAREPFWGGTYFPPEERFGRPGFRQVLDGVAHIYRADPDKVARNTGVLVDFLRQQASANTGAATIEPVVLDRMAERIANEVDPVNGGIGTAPKFPHFGALTLLWRAWLRSGEESLSHAVELTLEAMCEGGIYDHLGGGFARYATDAEWLVPHFEKMLYDNAQAVELLTTVFLGTAEPLYRQRLFETVEWLRREMLIEVEDRVAGFAATLDADSEGEEGRFYVWSEAEIDDLLAEKAPVFKAAYDVTGLGNWEGSNILNRSRGVASAEAETEALLASCRATLFRARSQRVPPARDDKLLADWNGMMIAALARAGFVFEQADWLKLARGGFDFAAENLGEGDALWHSWRADDSGQGLRRGPGTLDDYAQMARAALRLYQYQGDGALLQRAQRWVDHLNRHFWDEQAGGYFMVSDRAGDVIIRPRHATDQATPAGNGVMVEVLGQLFFLTGDQAYLERLDKLIAGFSGELGRNFFPLATFINGVDYVHAARQVVVIGRPDEPETEGLIDALRRHRSPDILLLLIDEGTALAAGHPASGKTRIDGQPTAYVCRGMACLPPVTTPADLAALLNQPG